MEAIPQLQPMSDDKTLELPEGMTVETAADVLREFYTTDDAQIVSSDALEAKDSKIEELSDVFRDALKEQKDLPEGTVEGMTVDALTAPFRNDDGEIEADTLAQNPETQTGDTPSDDGGDDGLDALSAEEKQEVRDKLDKADMMDDRTPEYADTLRSDAAEIAGVEDHSEIELEAL